MALDFITQNAIATDADIITRVRQAILTAAIAISAEDPETANHEHRIELAFCVLRSPEVYARLFAYGLATLAVSAEPTDAQISAAAAALWDAYAGTS